MASQQTTNDNEYESAFDSYCRKTEGGLSVDERQTLTEYKTLLAGNDTLGGYYLSPPDMAADILKNVILMSPIRSLGRVTTIGVQSLKLPKRTGVFAATRVGEIAQRNETLGYTCPCRKPNTTGEQQRIG